jgi:Zn-dependent peptidase ImmA (M78 family)
MKKQEDPKEIFGQRLAQARRMRGMSLRALADATGGKITYNALHRYELGQMMPSDDVLIAVADALDQALDFFFRPATVKLQEIKFRKTSGLGAKSEDAIREKALDFFERYQEIENILGLSAQFKDPLGQFRLDKPDDTETAAEKIRKEWKLGEDALPSVVEILEGKGVKVFEVEAPERFSGFAGWTDGHPVMVLAKGLNTDIPRKRLTALHELAHILFRSRTDMSHKEMEHYCFRFAGAMLIPQNVFAADWGGFRHRVSLEELIDLKRRYGISIAAFMYRAIDLGLVDKGLYEHFQIVRKKRGWHKPGKEPGEYLGIEISSRFEQLVLRAASEEIITRSKGAALLNEPVASFSRKMGDLA